MPVIFTCPYCHRRGLAKDRVVGTEIKCPSCKQPLLLPCEAEEAAEEIQVSAADVIAEPPPRPWLKFYCPECGHRNHGTPGETINCLECGQALEVPLPRKQRPVVGSLRPPQDDSDSIVQEESKPDLMLHFGFGLVLFSFGLSAMALAMPMMFAQGFAAFGLILAIGGIIAIGESRQPLYTIIPILALLVAGSLLGLTVFPRFRP